jgi:hypothetical protein
MTLEDQIVAASEYIYREKMQKKMFLMIRSGIGGLWKCKDHS